MANALNIDAAKVGGLTIIKIGRLTLCFAVSREFRPIGANAAAKAEARAARLERRKRREGTAWLRGYRAGSRPGLTYRAG